MGRNSWVASSPSKSVDPPCSTGLWSSAATSLSQIAAELVGAILDHAVAAGVSTLFAQPQGLDRIWVRYGFIPLPEGALPEGLSGRAGEGLYAWRGGSAVWSLRSIDTG